MGVFAVANEDEQALLASGDDDEQTKRSEAGRIRAHKDDDEPKKRFTTDDIIAKLSPPFDKDEVVTFRGWLGPLENGFYKLFTSRALDRWLQIPQGDLRYQLPGNKQRDHDAFSIVWVKHEARLTECHTAKACRLAEADFQVDRDPTATYPNYGGH